MPEFIEGWGGLEGASNYKVMKKNLIILIIANLVFTASYSQSKNEGKQSQSSDNSKPTVYMIGTSHLDTQWQWTIQTSINTYIPTTLTDNFKLFEKYPGYKFSYEGAIKYMFMKEYYPKDYERVKDYVATGQWNICGSSLDAGDVNIPSPEAVIRSILLGQNFYKHEFNKKSYDIYLPDCFGFGYALPTIMNHCGLKGFSTCKLAWGSPVGIPFDVGAWQGVDGSKVFAAINPSHYISSFRGDLSRNTGWLDQANKVGKLSGAYISYNYFGIGDRGGAPEDATVDCIMQSMKSDGLLKVMNVPADLPSQLISNAQLEKMPQYRGELLTSPHGVGCYTSQSAMKRWNQKNELLADAAERASVMADWLGAAKYPKARFDEAWTRFLWHQFHDDLTGTSIPEVYHFSWNDELLSQKTFASILENAAGGITNVLDTRVKGLALVVYNPLSIEREDMVEAELSVPSTMNGIKVIDKTGKEVPSQIITSNGKKLKILVLAKMAPVSFEVFDVQVSDKKSEMSTGLNISGNMLENSQYKVMLDKNGDVSSIFRKDLKKELLKEPIRLQLLNDTSAQWPAWEIMPRSLSQAPRTFVDNPIIKIVENGPVRICLEVTRKKESSTFVQRISLSAGNAGNSVVFDNHVNWNTLATLLKASFSLSSSNPKATYDLGIGTIERGNNTPKLYEVPAQQWADITDANNSFGVTVMTDCKHGWDKPADNTLRLSLVRTPSTFGFFADESTNDLGIHDFKFAVQGHKNNWREGLSQWEAAKLNQPLIAFQSNVHEGNLGKSFSLAQVSTNQVSVKALKLAENSDEIIIRVQELFGKDIKKVTIIFPVNILTVKEVNGIEEEIGKLSNQKNQFTFDLKSYQPKAFAIKLNKSPVSVAPKTSVPLALDYDIDGISTDENRTDGNFDNQGYTYPAELMPSKLVCDDIQFNLGPKEDGKKNFLSCNGERISLPTGDFNSISILASALKDKKVFFEIDGQKQEVEIPYYSGNIGQWDSRERADNYKSGNYVNGKFVSNNIYLKPAFVKRTPVAMYTTHRHDGANGENEAYVFCYLFKLTLNIPKDAKMLTLPSDPDVRIAAISIANDPAINTKPTQPLYDLPDRLPNLKIKLVTVAGSAYDPELTQVEIEPQTPESSIFYSLDGSTPDDTSMKYGKPFRITKSATIQAVEYTNGKPVSTIAFKEYYNPELLSSQNLSDLKPGLKYSYYEDNDKKPWEFVPDFSKLTPQKQGVVNSFVFPDVVRKNNYGLTYKGYLNIPVMDGVIGIYTFTVNCDEAAKLYIDDKLIVNNDGIHVWATDASGKASLGAGMHKIALHYFKPEGDKALEVYIEGPGVIKQVLPAGMLWY